MTKYFCIGLHKQGTSSLAEFARINGLRALHHPRWQFDFDINDFDFFSDGGGHYEGIREFEFEKLLNTFEDSKFILQYRDPKLWIISKLSHAGWGEDTVFTEGDPSRPPTHDEWRDKTLVNIDRFLTQKRNYEEKVRSFFGATEQLRNRFISIDVTSGSNHENSLLLAKFMSIEDGNFKALPWINKGKDKGRNSRLPKEVLEFISSTIERIY